MREYLSAFTKIEFDKIRQRIRGYLQTAAGAEHIDALAPRTDPSGIREELALTTEMKGLLAAGSPPPIRTLPDLRTSIQRAAILEYVLPPQELLSIAHLAATARELRSHAAANGAAAPGLAAEARQLTAESILEFNILRAIDAEARVADGASRELATIRRAIRRKNDALRGQMEKILDALRRKGVAQEDLITTRDGRLVVPVRAEYKHQVPGFIHSISASGATAFIEPTETLEMHNEIRTLESRERREIEVILKELTAQVAEAVPRLLVNLAVIARIDFLHAKARHSIEIGGNEPTVGAGGAIRLRSAVHPLLLAKHRREEITPLDIDAGREFRTLIISGPNAGGKSVAMKTVGLLAAMAQSGCHIPASPDSEISPFTEIFVEMGDEQSIENDLSTFSSHLRNLKVIVEHATSGSLVLIDEIGNGTDPALGSALGIAVLERLTSAGALTIVTSHHSAFKTAGFDRDGMENAGMGFDPVTLTPTYRLSVGRPGNSYALEIARNLDFPRDVVERSMALAGGENVTLSESISRFDEQNHRLAAELAEAERLRRELETMQRAYRSKLLGVGEEVKAIRSGAAGELRSLIDGSRRRLEQLIREVRESGADRASIQEARKALEEIDSSRPAPPDDVPPRPGGIGDLRPGMFVRIHGMGSAGEILEVLDAHRVVVEASGKRIVVRKESLEPAPERPAPTAHAQDQIDYTKIPSELDLRGLYGDESMPILDQFLDRAVLMRLGRVRIIHGKGSGALRKRVAEHLGRHSQVESFHLGEWNEGGAGVTIAILRS